MAVWYYQTQSPTRPDANSTGGALRAGALHGISLRACYAMSGTAVAYGGTCRYSCVVYSWYDGIAYAPRTEAAYGATAFGKESDELGRRFRAQRFNS
eukprot:437097-Rhodomonas_salina.4